MRYLSELTTALLIVTVTVALSGCKSRGAKEQAAPPVAPKPAPVKRAVALAPPRPAPTRKGAATTPKPPTETAPLGPFRKLTRTEFNRAAVRLNLPLYWRGDADRDGEVDPGEVVRLLFYPPAPAFVRGGKFTPAFAKAYAAMEKSAEVPPGLPEAERARRRLVLEELRLGEPTLIYHDLRQAPEWERRFVRAIVEVSKRIDRLHARITGARALRPRIPATDLASRSLLRRNWMAKCLSRKLVKETRCTALAGARQPVYGLYPADLQRDPGFCRKLEKHPKAKELLAPFVVVRRRDKKLVAVPFHVAYPRLMNAISAALRDAAKTIPPGPSEEALKAYLLAAATSFSDNDWERADEAWSKMSARNSRWYLRVGPDEVYWEPCNRKGGFHVLLAYINRDSLTWRDRLAPYQQETERRLATLIGPPYRERKVAFQLPDFLQVVLTAGDDRDPFDGAIGQSLPNWGKVADENRGRTVVMSNFFRDPDSIHRQRVQARALFDAKMAASFTTSPLPRLVTTILHEAAHNLGPSHDYKVRGRNARDAFGGGLASVLEELKAEAASLWYLPWLKEKGLISAEIERQAQVEMIFWSLRQLSRGLFDDKGKPKAYGQVGAILVGWLLDKGALRFNRAAAAANGGDRGAFSLRLDRVAGAATSLMRRVGRVKGRADKAAAVKLIRRYVRGTVVPKRLITERMERFPRASFVYGLSD